MSEPQPNPIIVNPTNIPVADTPPVPELKGDIKTLKDAFPDLDVEVIEAILDSQGGNLDSTFEVLLGMSDPTYKPTQQEVEGLSQLRKDEEYARKLAREGDAHYPQQSNQQPSQPLFNLQEELPIIKEKVIEAGTAAKNKIMSFYNQLMAPEGQQQQQQQRGSSSTGGGGVLESRMGNLSVSDYQQRPSPTMKNSSVDLYEWDGKGPETRSNPAVQTPKKDNLVTSTSSDQLMSDEEFARQLAKEEEETAAAIAASVNESPRRRSEHTTPTVESPKQPQEQQQPQPKKQQEQLSDESEVSFSALRDLSPKTTPVDKGYHVQVEDDLDDLFDKQDSVPDLKQLDESSSEAAVTKK